MALIRASGGRIFLHAAADFRGDADALLPLDVDCECGHATFAHHLHFTLDGLLDVLRIEVVTANDQHVFQAAGDEQLTVTQKKPRSPVRSQVRPACWTNVLAVASGLRQ